MSLTEFDNCKTGVMHMINSDPYEPSRDSPTVSYSWTQMPKKNLEESCCQMQHLLGLSPESLPGAEETGLSPDGLPICEQSSTDSLKLGTCVCQV